MNKTKVLTAFLALFIVTDVIFSFIQYYNQPLYGELDGCVLPNKEIKKIFDDPLGFKAISKGEEYINPNRYFSHAPLSVYFKTVPFGLQYLMSPINSVYTTSALVKLLVQVTFICSLAFLIAGSEKFFSRKTLIAAVLITPLFQVYGYYSRMGIVDRSVLYTFFYGLPLVILMLILIFFRNVFFESKKIKWFHFLIILPFTVMLPMSCPLVAPIILIISLMIVGVFVSDKGLKINSIITEIKNVPLFLTILWVFFNLWSLYSLYLGYFNSNFEKDVIPIGERYLRLPAGLITQIFHSLGFPLMLIMIDINQFLLKKNLNAEEYKIWRKRLLYVGLFSLIYIVLLPLGGYRPYRPKIIRYDMIIPITMLLIYYFGASTFRLLEFLKNRPWKQYAISIAVILLFYTFSDTQGIGRNKMERETMQFIAQSPDSIVVIPKNAIVIGYETVSEPKKSIEKAKLMYFWKITDKQKLFYNQSE